MTRTLRWLLAAGAGALVLVASPGASAQGYARGDLLIETEAAAKLLGQPNVRLIDAADAASYQRAHIPGAVNIFYLDVAKLDSRKKNGHPLSEADAEKIFGDAGIDANTQVVVYDGGEGPFASGVWFALDFFGHKQVRVLNGGFRKWLKEGRPVTQDAPTVEKKKFAAKPGPEKVATRDWIEKNLRNKEVVFVDTRSFNEYIGKDVRPGASRGGHLPSCRKQQAFDLLPDCAHLARRGQTATSNGSGSLDNKGGGGSPRPLRRRKIWVLRDPCLSSFEVAQKISS